MKLSLVVSVIVGLGLATGAIGCSAETASSTASDDFTGAGATASPELPLSSLSVAGEGAMAFSYTVGGGCSEHRAVATAARTGEGKVVVTVSDVVNAPDHCEALLSINGTADLKKLIAEAESKAGPSAGGRFEVTLPRVGIDVGAASGAPVSAAPEGAALSLSTVSLDRSGKLAFSYTTGGGCSSHTAATTVDLVKQGEHSYVANVKVFDVSATPDPCEALLSVDGTADLSTLIADAAVKAGLVLEGRSVDVVLPNLAIATW